MTKIIKNEKVYVKAEVGGVEAVIASADVIRVMDITAAPESKRLIERASVTGAMGMPKSLYGGSLMGITFSTELTSGANNASEQAALFEACGFVLDESNAGYHAYNPSSSPTQHKSMTVHYAQDGILRKILNARATAASFAFTAGETAKMSITLVGKDGGESDAASPVPAFNANSPIVCRGAMLVDLQGEVDKRIESLNIDLGLTTALIADMRDADGYADVRITDRNVSGSVNPEVTTIADADWWTRVRNSTSGNIQLTVGAVGNQMSFIIPSGVFTEYADGDRGGVRTRELSFMAARTGAGDNEIQIRT